MSQPQVTSQLNPQTLDEAILQLLSPTNHHQKFQTQFMATVHQRVTEHFYKYQHECQLTPKIHPEIAFDFFFENYRIPVIITYNPQDQSIRVIKFNDFFVNFPLS